MLLPNLTRSIIMPLLRPVVLLTLNLQHSQSSVAPKIESSVIHSFILLLWVMQRMIWVDVLLEP